MRKAPLNCFLFIIPALALLGLISCNNHTADIPFPVSDSNYTQPLSKPLEFGQPKKIKWLTVKEGGIKPVIRKLDIDKLPSVPYDTSGFKPFRKPVEETHFDFNTLPATTLDLGKIPSHPLKFKTYISKPPVTVKAVPLSYKTGPTISISELGKGQGLQGRDVLDIIKSKNGFIWLCTQTGIYRYDGEHMQLYSNFFKGASGIVEDNNGRIWNISPGGIGVLDIEHGTESISTDLNTPFPNLPKMIVDDKGQIWISRIGDKGAAILDPYNLTYKHLANGNLLSGKDTWAILEDGKKNIWLTGNGGADIINPERNKITSLKKINGLANDTLGAITGDSKGRIWIAFRHGGVSSVDIEHGSIENYGNQQDLNNILTYELLCDDKNKIWMATNHGLSILDPEKKLTKHVREKDGIPEDFVLGLFEDYKNRVWVGTFSGGLNIIEQNAELVHPVGSKSLSTLMEDSSGNIWVGAGTSSDGIVILDKEKKVARVLNKEHGLGDNFIQNCIPMDGNIWVTTDGGFDIIDPYRKTIAHTGEKEGLSSDTVYGILKDRRNNIWLTGPSEGIDVIDSARKTILHAGTAQGLTDQNILDVKSDGEGKIWLATYSKGVDVIDQATNTVRNLNMAPGLKDSCYRLLMLDNNDRIWIGTDKGVYVADTKRGTLTSITTKEGLCNDYINSLVLYKDKVYVGTQNKVSIITPPAYSDPADTLWKIALLAGSEGLFNSSNNWNTNIITKNGKYLWGDAGITIINDLKERHDSAQTLISGMNIMTQSYFFTSNVEMNDHDTIWGTDSFYTKNQTPPNIALLHKKGIHWDSAEGPYNMPANLQVPYDQNYLQFQFGQQHLGSQEQTLYCYILEGIDKQWSAFTTNAFTENYLNLSPGNYTFKVRSRNVNGRWGPLATFSFVITPPWWKTWWAYTLYVLIFVGSVWAFIYYRSKQLLKENRILEEKVEHRTNQLKKSLDELRATQTQLIQSEKMASLGELTAGIAHEIQNPLNFVNNFSDLSVELAGELKETLNSTEVDPAKKTELEAIVNDIVQNQQKINFHGKRADAIVKGMLQHSRSSSGIKEPTDINTLADEYFRLSYHGLRAKDKSFNAKTINDFDPSLEKVNMVPQDMGRVILNLITNAFYSVTEKKKLNIEGYEPTVWVSTKKVNGKTEIHVKDNGMGVPQKVLDKIFQPFFTTKPVGQGTGLGLSLSYDIVKAHGGELKVETKEGEGAEFIIQLPS